MPSRVDQVIDERKRAEKRLSDVEAELAKILAGGLSKEMTQQVGGGMYKMHLHRTDDSSNVLGFLSAISFEFTNITPIDGKPYLVVLTSSPSVQTASSTTVVLLFGNDDKRVKEAGEVLKSKLGVKGGGKGPKWSGKFMGQWKEVRECIVIEELLSTL